MRLRHCFSSPSPRVSASGFRPHIRPFQGPGWTALYADLDQVDPRYRRFPDRSDQLEPQSRGLKWSRSTVDRDRSRLVVLFHYPKARQRPACTAAGPAWGGLDWSQTGMNRAAVYSGHLFWDLFFVRYRLGPPVVRFVADQPGRSRTSLSQIGDRSIPAGQGRAVSKNHLLSFSLFLRRRR